ncbi:hypothetical protein [Stenotrophomonas sp.]|uniref:hypothetical protein n=1 Tax=Stenotrophomonas sp. TaxID=69392 RepID=UPI00289A2FE4|nr:hypothetical protein [Stenotrophomonas sp.]
MSLRMCMLWLAIAAPPCAHGAAQGEPPDLAPLAEAVQQLRAATVHAGHEGSACRMAFPDMGDELSHASFDWFMRNRSWIPEVDRAYQRLVQLQAKGDLARISQRLADDKAEERRQSAGVEAGLQALPAPQQRKRCEGFAAGLSRYDESGDQIAAPLAILRRDLHLIPDFIRTWR